MEKINNFLCMNGSNKFFVASVRNDDHSATAAHHKHLNTPNATIGQPIYIIETIMKLPRIVQENLDSSIILYFLRHDTNQEVSQTQMYKEIFCGEIKNVSQILFNVFNELFLTTFNSNQTWKCSKTTANVRVQSIRNMEKFVNSLNELSMVNSSQKNFLLKKVEPEAVIELKQARIIPDSPIIRYCEDLASEWMLIIENILSDICDERVIHQSVGPSSELERWQRKQRLLSSLTEQLKTKECKSVMSALITSKSRVLKRWKVIDTG